jgi:HSP20 family protein
MSTLSRREPLHMDFPEWMTRWLDERGLAERLPLDLGPALRIEELTEGDVRIIRAELPGIDPGKDVEISVHDGMLHIAGERTQRSEDRENGSVRTEFRYGRFERAVPLPAGSSAEDVTATYKDGVLEVRMPTQPQAREAAKVPVQRID